VCVCGCGCVHVCVCVGVWVYLLEDIGDVCEGCPDLEAWFVELSLSQLVLLLNSVDTTEANAVPAQT
jgi:hypothetical protein